MIIIKSRASVPKICNPARIIVIATESKNNNFSIQINASQKNLKFIFHFKIMNQSKNKSKVRSILRKNSINYKTVQALIENGPLTTQEVMRVTGYYNPRIGNTLCQSPEIYFMGNTRCGIWYLEYQNQDARERYCELCKEAEKRLENNRKNQLKLTYPNADSFILSKFEDGEEITAEKVWNSVKGNVVSGNIIDLRVRLSQLVENGDLSVKGKSPKIYKLNSNQSN